MNVTKMVAIDPIEPAPLSLRIAAGVDTYLNINFVTQAGIAVTSDLASQLQLTGRSTARTNTYFLPATDIANGRARARIPGDALTDPNGYRLRLVGTVNGDAALLAVGTVMPIFAAGMEAIPDDIIDTIELTLTRGQVAQVGVKLWDDAGGTNPFDLTEESTTVTSSIYAARSGAVLVPFTVTVVAPNEVSLTLTVEQVNALPDLCWWSLVASNEAGAHTLCEGNVTVKDLMGAYTYMISLYYLATSGQTAFPVTVPDRFGHVAAFTAQTVPHVSRGGVRISPVDGFNVAGDTITLVNPAGDDEPITIDVWGIV